MESFYRKKRGWDKKVKSGLFQARSPFLGEGWESYQADYLTNVEQEFKIPPLRQTKTEIRFRY